MRRTLFLFLVLLTAAPAWAQYTINKGGTTSSTEEQIVIDPLATEGYVRKTAPGVYTSEQILTPTLGQVCTTGCEITGATDEAHALVIGDGSGTRAIKFWCEQALGCVRKISPAGDEVVWLTTGTSFKILNNAGTVIFQQDEATGLITVGQSQVGATSSQFNGTTSKISVADSSPIDATVFTFSAWIYRTGDGEATFGRIADKLQGTSAGWSFGYTDNGGADDLILIAGTTGTDPEYTLNSPSGNAWHHVAFSFSKTAFDAAPTTYKPSFWVDGVAIAAGSITIGTTPGGTYSAGTNILTFGNQEAADLTWDGSLANLCYHNVALVTADVAQVMNWGCLSVAGVIGYWPLGRFGGANFTNTASLGGTMTAITLNTTQAPTLLKGPGL